MNLRLLFTIMIIHLFCIDGFSQSVGGWGTCEFATVALLNAFDPSNNSFDCKKAFVQATDEHYHWDGTSWVIDGSAVNIYTSNDTIVSNRTVTMDGKSLSFDGTGDVIIQDDGKVGIGTTTPKSQLEVNYNRSPSFAPDVDNGINKYLSSIVGLNTNNSSWSRTLSALTPNVPDGSVAGLLTFGQGDATRQAGHMYFVDEAVDGEEYISFGIRSGSYNILNLTGDGNIGIGTTTPTQKLDIAGVNKVQIGTFGGSGGGKLRVDISDGEAEAQGIKTMLLQTTGTNYAINATAAGVGATKNTALYGWASGATTNFGLWVDNGWGIFDDRVGIGTASPDAQLDVENGTVRFSEYGTGTNTGTDSYVLSVDADGDVIEMNTAISSKIFYPPAMTLDASAIVASQTLDLHQEYVDLYGTPAIVSTGAPAAIPTYAEDELYYYLTEYDTAVFDNVSIDEDGVLTYDIISVPADQCAFITMVFVVK